MCDDNAFKYFLCIHCLRVFKENNTREEESLAMCPYTGCDGKAMFSARWETLRKRFPQLPEEPEEDVVYDIRKCINARNS